MDFGEEINAKIEMRIKEVLKDYDLDQSEFLDKFWKKTENKTKEKTEDEKLKLIRKRIFYDSGIYLLLNARLNKDIVDLHIRNYLRFRLNDEIKDIARSLNIEVKNKLIQSLKFKIRNKIIEEAENINKEYIERRKLRK